jgi:hypothetical protein
MKNQAVWREELFSEIRTIANESELEALWLGLDSNATSSFAEEVAHIFDDYDINGFISLGANEIGLQASQLQALCRFRDLLSDYVDQMRPININSIDPNLVLNDPRWKAVVVSAADFIQSLV